MNTDKFIAAFIPLIVVASHAAAQIYLNGTIIDNSVLAFVMLGMFIFGIGAYTYKYNLVLFVVTVVPVMMLGIYLTSPLQTQVDIIMILKTLIQGVIQQ